MIALRELSKRFGDTVAVDELDVRRQAGGRDGISRAERRREVDDDAPDPGARQPDRRLGDRSTGARTGSCPAPMREVGAVLDATAIHGKRSAYQHLRWLAQAGGIPPQPHRRGARSRRVDGSRPEARRRLLTRYAPAAGHRRGVAGRPRKRCCSTSRPTASTRKACSGCERCSGSSPPKGGRSSSPAT